jgi:glutathione S-transferase
MPYVHLVIALALVEFFYFAIEVSRARTRYNIPAPATTGNEVFERYFRVQMNTLELLIIFIPSILIFSTYMSPHLAAAIGAVYIVGRLIYLYTYTRDPRTRSLGFGLSVAPTLILLIGGIVGAAKATLL